MKRLLRILFINPTDNALLQLFRYGFVGAIAFVVDYGTMILLREVAGLNYLLAAAISFLLGLTVNYLISISWVFNTGRHVNPKVEFIAFTLIGVIGLGLNELIMYISTDCLSIHYMLSKLISTALVFFWNFLARKVMLFNGKAK